MTARSRSRFQHGFRFQYGAALSALLVLTLSGCTMKSTELSNQAKAEAASGNTHGATDASLAGSVEADGSSTVYPITQAVAEEFMKSHPKVAIRVNISGKIGRASCRERV